jgi:hypothetical protein
MSTYTLDIEEVDDDTRFNPKGYGYKVTVSQGEEELGEFGMAEDLKPAIIEALRFAGVIK